MVATCHSVTVYPSRARRDDHFVGATKMIETSTPHAHEEQGVEGSPVGVLAAPQAFCISLCA